VTEIGKPEKEIEVIPLYDPVPKEEPVQTPEEAPVEAPPELVPA
jgi:hypothetical protein